MLRGSEEALLHLRLWPRLGDLGMAALFEDEPVPERALERQKARDPAGRATLAEREPAVQRALAWLDREPDAELRGRVDADYPKRLKELYDPPGVILLQGDVELLNRPGLTVVGTRTPTEYGRDVAWTLSRDLARAGLVVISGMARGIDAAAHGGALDAPGGTIAVLASGPDVPTPRQHGTLQRRVRDHGLLVTEFLPGEAARPFHFPRRNRILAALGLGVLVVEAGEGSGALITVSHGEDLGLDVFAVPGPVGRPTSEGPNRLLHQGAAVVRDVEDVLAELTNELAEFPDHQRAPPDDAAAAPPPELADDPLAVWRALADQSQPIDPICQWTGLPPGRVYAALVELELSGLAVSLAGSRYRRAGADVGNRAGRRG